MTSNARRTSPRAVPERFGWTLKVLLAFAVLFELAALVAAVVQTIQLVTWLQPGARIPVTVATSYSLPTNGGQNSYGGIPFVRDGTAVVATQVSTVLNSVPFGARLAMGLTPLLATVTTLAVTALLGIALYRLAGGVPFGRDASRPVTAAAIALAIGSVLSQAAANLLNASLGVFAWAAPVGGGTTLSRTGGPTIDLTPLVIACGLLVLSLILRRGLALRQDLDGLV